MHYCAALCFSRCHKVSKSDWWLNTARANIEQKYTSKEAFSCLLDGVCKAAPEDVLHKIVSIRVAQHVPECVLQ